MPTIRTLPAIVASATGQDQLLVRRLTSELSDAGFLPTEANAEVSQPEVGTLLFVLAAARSPSEAIDCLSAHLSVPLRHASVSIDGQEHPLTAEQYAEFAATAQIPEAASAPEWFAHVLTPRDERTAAHRIISVECSAEIGCGVDGVFSSLRLRMHRVDGEPWGLFLVFCQSSDTARLIEFATVRRIGNSVFAALSADLCGSNTLYETKGAALAAAMN